MRFLSLSELKKLATNRLMAYKRKLYNGLWWNRYGCDCDGCAEMEEYSGYVAKHIEEVKSVLNTREHVELKEKKPNKVGRGRKCKRSRNRSKQGK